jgi:hypothetical protein
MLRPLSLLLAATLAGCGSVTALEPAPDAHLVRGTADAAIDRAGGLIVIAEADAWAATPRDLERQVVPLRVTIRNDGREAVTVGYGSFALEAPDGTSYAAIRPSEIGGTALAMRPAYTHPTEGVLPTYFRPYYPFAPSFSHPFAASAPFFADHAPRNVRVRLPTEDMLDLALPEGVIPPGGSASGFLYFERPPAGAALTAVLRDAATRARIASVRIPLAANA